MKSERQVAPMVPFKAPHSLMRSILSVVLSPAAGGVCCLVFLLLHTSDPQTFSEKLCEVILFCLCAAGIGFSVAFFAAGLRDLLEGPAVEVTDETFRIAGSRPIPLSDLKKTEITFSRNGKKAKALIFLLHNGETKKLSSSETGVPLETVEYAVKLRKEKIKT